MMSTRSITALRILAGLIDAALVAVFLVASVLLPAGTPALLDTALLVAAACVALVDGIILPAATGQTLGTRIAGVRIVVADGPARKGIGPIRAIVRFLVQTGVSPVFMLGFLWHVVDKHGRTWHDILAGTTVIPVDATIPMPVASRSRLRLAFGALVGMIGLVLMLLPFWLPLALEKAALARPSSASEIPADFPVSVVLPEDGKPVFISVRDDLKKGTREVHARWGALPADPTSLVLAYRAGFEALGYGVDIVYADVGPQIIFKNPALGVVGGMEIVPSDDLASIRAMTLITIYPIGAEKRGE